MKRTMRILFRALLILVVVLLAGLAAGWVYLTTHKAQILAYIRTESAKKLRGELVIGDVDASFATFPRISIALHDVRLRDSLYARHGHDLLAADRVYAGFDLWKLITGTPRIDRIQLDRALIYIYTDSTGYTNTSVFRKSPPGEPKERSAAFYPLLDLRQSRLVVEKRDRNKFFDFALTRLTATISQASPDSPLDMSIGLDATVHAMAFNQEKGSFLAGKTVRGNFPIRFDAAGKILSFSDASLRIDEQAFALTGKFWLAQVPAPFQLSARTTGLSFRQAGTFVTPNIRRKLEQYNVEPALGDVALTLDATDTALAGQPKIRVQVAVGDRTVTTPLASFDHSSFSGFYFNEVVPGKGRGDDNSEIRIDRFEADWQGIPLRADSIVVHDLTKPVLACALKSSFPLTSVNDLFEDDAISLDRGRGRIDLFYRGPVDDGTGLPRYLKGEIGFDSTTLRYAPRNFSLSGCRGRIRFTGDDMIIDELAANTGNTDLVMHGDLRSLFSLIDKGGDKALLEWSVRAGRLNLNDFTGFLNKRQANNPGARKRSKVLFAETIRRITDVLETASMRLAISARQLTYKKFEAADLRANVALTGDRIDIRDTRLRHAGGSMALDASVINETGSNPMTLKVRLDKVDVPKLFAAFDNFGQTAINDRNLRGLFSADIDLHTRVTDKAKLVPDSLRGTVRFLLENGQLVDFEPVKKISQTIFKKRDFSDIQFANLQDRFDVAGTTITVNRMEIRSTVMTMFVEGLYDLKKGADLSIQVPLSNLKDPKNDSVLVNQGIDSKTGVSARLRARNGADGKLKISWDPFKKAVRRMRKK